MWTQERLRALYERYNRRYWDGELLSFKIDIRKQRHHLGFTDHHARTIGIDVARHYDDDEIRLTLLHEMLHVAALDGVFPKSATHGVDFRREVERILRKGAPAELVLPISSQVRAILRRQPSRTDLYFCKRAVRKMEEVDKRFRQREEENRLEDEHQKTLAQFRAAAPDLTWTQAVARIGPSTDCLDEHGKPRSRRKANVAAFLKRAFQKERRWHLRIERRRKQGRGRSDI